MDAQLRASSRSPCAWASWASSDETSRNSELLSSESFFIDTRIEASCFSALDLETESLAIART